MRSERRSILIFRPSSSTCRFSSRVPNRVSMLGLSAMLFFIQDCGSRLQQLWTGLTLGFLLPGCGLPPDSDEPVPSFFARKELDGKVEQCGLRTPTTGRFPTI